MILARIVTLAAGGAVAFAALNSPRTTVGTARPATDVDIVTAAVSAEISRAGLHATPADVRVVTARRLTRAVGRPPARFRIVGARIDGRILITRAGWANDPAGVTTHEWLHGIQTTAPTSASEQAADEGTVEAVSRDLTPAITSRLPTRLKATRPVRAYTAETTWVRELSRRLCRPWTGRPCSSWRDQRAADMRLRLIELPPVDRLAAARMVALQGPPTDGVDLSWIPDTPDTPS